MKIIETYSHLNGLEFLLVHKQKLWEEIKGVITLVDAEACKTKVSKEKSMIGKLLYSPIDMNVSFKNLLTEAGWQESRVNFHSAGYKPSPLGGKVFRVYTKTKYMVLKNFFM